MFRTIVISCALLFAATAFTSCEEPRRKTKKEKEREEWERNHAPKPLTKRVYTYRSRSGETVKGYLLKRFSDGLLIEAEESGQRFAIKITNVAVSSQKAVVRDNVPISKGTVPLPGILRGDADEIARLEKKSNELHAQIYNRNTRQSLKSNLNTELRSVQRQLEKLRARERAVSKGKEFLPVNPD